MKLKHGPDFGTQGVKSQNILQVCPERATKGGGGYCTACARRLKTRTLLFGEGTRLGWHVCAVKSRPQV